MHLFFIKRFFLVYLCLILATMPTESVAFSRISASDLVLVNKISDKLTALKTLTGNFVQVNPDEKKVYGRFYLKRPGRIRFIYDRLPLEIISDGHAVLSYNKKLKTAALNPLEKTPLYSLLASKINFNTSNLYSVVQENGFVTLVTSYLNPFGTLSIQLTFDKKKLMLKQWLVVDPNGETTAIVLYNVIPNRKLESDLFKIDYSKIQKDE